MPQTEPLLFLTNWFSKHCDGDWEHDEGVRLETLDNPGWALDIRTQHTELDGRVVDWVRDEQSDEVWLHWRSTAERFEARCGPNELHRALRAFQFFARNGSQPATL